MRLIDADALAKDLEYDIEIDNRALDCMDLVGVERDHIQRDKDCKQNCMQYLTCAPTIDAVPVVRCGECKYRIVNKNYGKKGYLNIKAMCELDTGDLFALGRCAEDDNWFCADGERKDGDA